MAREYVRQIDVNSFSRKTTMWQQLHIDPYLLFLLIIAAATGMSMLYAAADNPLYSLKRQASFFTVAFVVMLFVAQLPMRFYKNSAPFLYVAGIILLLLVPILGTGAKGAQRWLAFPVIGRFQPSEVLKLVMPLIVAWYLSPRVLPPRFKYVLVTLAIIAVPTLLIDSQPDLGTSILIASSGLFVW